MVNVELNFGGNPFAHVLIFWKFSVTDTKTGYHRFHGIDRFFLFLQRHSTRSEGQSFATGESVNCHYLLFQPEQGVQCPSARIQPLKGTSHTISLPPHPRLTIQVSRSGWLPTELWNVAVRSVTTCDWLSALLERDIALQISWRLETKHYCIYCKVQTSWTVPRQSVILTTGCLKKLHELY